MNRAHIAITVNANGQRVAYRDSRRNCGGWQRIALATAELLIATEQAVRVPFVTYSNGRPSPMNQTSADV